MGLIWEKVKVLRMVGDVNNILIVFCVFVLNCNIFCGGIINCILDIKWLERRQNISQYFVYERSNVIR